jgi:hypothetical protein
MTAHFEYLEAVGPLLLRAFALTAAFAVFAPLLTAYVAPFIG